MKARIKIIDEGHNELGVAFHLLQEEITHKYFLIIYIIT